MPASRMKKSSMARFVACIVALVSVPIEAARGSGPGASSHVGSRCSDYVDYLRPFAPKLTGSSEGQYGARHGLAALAVYVRGGGDAALAQSIRAALRSYSEWVDQQVATTGGVQSFDGVTLLPIYARELRGRGEFDREDEALLRHTILSLRQFSFGLVPGDGPWRGSQHRGMVDGTNNMIAAALYPRDPLAGEWRKRGQTVWNDWWQYRDIGINDSAYFSDSLAIMLRTADLLDRQEVFSDALVKATLWDRLLFETSPDGAAIPYGASAGWNGSAGIRIYALMLAAEKTGDGRYRFVADRLFNYARARGGFSPGQDHWAAVSVESLALAALACNDRLTPVKPDSRPKLLSRPEVVRLSSAEARTPLGRFDANMTMAATRMPSKVAFRTGWAPGDMFMLVEAFARHDPLNPTAILALERHGASFAEATYEKEVSHENAVRISDVSGEAKAVGDAKGQGRRVLPTGYHDMATTVDPVAGGKLAAHAKLTVVNYAGYPVTQVRDILFVNTGFVLVRDESTFDDSFVARVGPAWNTQHAVGEKNASWIESWIDSHWYNQFLKLYDNPPGRLLIWHAPKAGAAISVGPAQSANVDEKDARAALNHFVTEEYTWQGRVEAGQKVQFTTVLLPHRENEEASRLAVGIRVIRDEAGLSAVMVGDQLAVLNATGSRVSIDTGRGTVVSDARALIVAFAGDSVVQSWHDGGKATLDGATLD